MTPASQTSPSTQSPKVLIATMLITAATTIGVSFIGVFPQLRSGDTKKFEQLRQEFDESKKQAAAMIAGLKITSSSDNKKMAITGTVYGDTDRKRTLNGVEIYLLPEGNNVLTAKTDDTGRFTLHDLPAGTYSIIVRDPFVGRSGKGLLDDSGDEVTVIGASVKYRIQK